MPMPQLTDRIKEAPAMALRAVFAGIGQVLLAVDKLRNDVLDKASAPPARPGQPARTAGPVASEAAGNVAALRPEPATPPAQAQAPAQAQGPAQAQAPAAPAPAQPAAPPAAPAQPASVEPPAPKPAASEPAAAATTAGTGTAPLPNYEELTIASLRARLRSMDAAQVRALLGYERAHANREAVVAMYERRLAKIAAGAG